MGKYFPEIAKAQEFLELKQGAMTVMDYVTRLTELTRFVDDYVATNLAKVRKFEDGMKLSIRARIIGLRLQDMDSMVGTALTIEREVEDARSTRDADASSKRKDSQSSSSSEKRQRASSARGSQSHGHPGQGQMRVTGQAGQMVCYHCQQPGHMRRGYSTFLHSAVKAREANLNFRELRGHPTFHRQAREARVWVETEDEAHRQGH